MFICRTMAVKEGQNPTGLKTVKMTKRSIEEKKKNQYLDFKNFFLFFLENLDALFLQP